MVTTPSSLLQILAQARVQKRVRPGERLGDLEGAAVSLTWVVFLARGPT